jgi:hypothetical protein
VESQVASNLERYVKARGRALRAVWLQFLDFRPESISGKHLTAPADAHRDFYSLLASQAAVTNAHQVKPSGGGAAFLIEADLNAPRLRKSLANVADHDRGAGIAADQGACFGTCTARRGRRKHQNPNANQRRLRESHPKHHDR